jgi:hypothetical protein
MALVLFPSLLQSLFSDSLKNQSMEIDSVDQTHVTETCVNGAVSTEGRRKNTSTDVMGFDVIFVGNLLPTFGTYLQLQFSGSSKSVVTLKTANSS